MKQFLRPLSPAMVVALIALFVSLGGVSYGLATGSITSRAIKDNTIQSRDIADNTIQSRDIRDGTIESRDVRDGTIESRDVRDGTIESRDVRDKTLRGGDIADGAITGGQIQDGSITRADVAPSQFVPAGKIVSSGSVITIPAGAGAGNIRTVLTSGPFTFRLRCVKDGDAPTSYIRAYLEVASTEAQSEVAANSAFKGWMNNPGTQVEVSQALGNEVAWAGGMTYGTRAPSGASLDGGFSLGVIGGASINVEPKRSCMVSMYGVS